MPAFPQAVFLVEQVTICRQFPLCNLLGEIERINHRIIESLRLEKAPKIIKSNPQMIHPALLIKTSIILVL